MRGHGRFFRQSLPPHVPFFVFFAMAVTRVPSRFCMVVCMFFPETSRMLVESAIGRRKSCHNRENRETTR
jgi:hypothetical protein